MYSHTPIIKQEGLDTPSLSLPSSSNSPLQTPIIKQEGLELETAPGAAANDDNENEDDDTAPGAGFGNDGDNAAILFDGVAGDNPSKLRGRQAYPRNTNLAVAAVHLYAPAAPIAPAATPPAPVPPPAPATPAGPINPQLAPTNRLPPPALNYHGKFAHPYYHRVPGRWWSKTQMQMQQMESRERNRWSHIGLIMETTLGEQVFGNECCNYCRERRFECWVYTEDAIGQVNSATGVCARCRVQSHKGGCSHNPDTGGNGKPFKPRGRRDLRQLDHRGGGSGAASGAVAVG